MNLALKSQASFGIRLTFSVSNDNYDNKDSYPNSTQKVVP